MDAGEQGVTEENGTVQAVEPTPPTKKPEGKVKRFWRRITATKKRRVLTILAGVVLLLGLLTLIPVTRYAVFGLVVKKDVTVTLNDATTHKPVSNAEVSLGSHSATTDRNGKAVVRGVPVGNYSLMFMKKYYFMKTGSYIVPLVTKPKDVNETLKANGRPVSFTVRDTVSGQPVTDATLSAGGSSATTDKAGQATIVLPDGVQQSASITASGYNQTDVKLAVNGDQSQNTFTVTRTGWLVYLSNASGKIDVVRAHLDGSSAATIVAGTGREQRYSTSLLSSRDWHYSVLTASRDSDKTSVYLVETDSGKLTNIDQGDATFNSVGWSGHKFIYTVNRNVSQYTDKQSSLKIYDADSGKLTTLDDTTGTGSDYYNGQYQFFSQVYIIDGEIVYLKPWTIGQSVFYGGDPGRSNALIAIDTTTYKKRTIKEFPEHQSYSNVYLALYEPQGIWVLDNDSNAYYEYEDGNLKTIDKPQTSDQYPTYLVSPSGNKTFWYELRNGKNTIFIGDKEGKNPQQIANLSEYVPYGWYGANDQYILFTKNGSELYIAPAGTISGAPLKVTDYYKVQSYPGYGYGYGGQ